MCLCETLWYNWHHFIIAYFRQNALTYIVFNVNKDALLSSRYSRFLENAFRVIYAVGRTQIEKRVVAYATPHYFYFFKNTLKLLCLSAIFRLFRLKIGLFLNTWFSLNGAIWYWAMSEVSRKLKSQWSMKSKPPDFSFWLSAVSWLSNCSNL